LIYNKGTGNTETKEVNTDQFIAWTKGKFVFENEPIENILKIMSRWYDFDFEFINGLKKAGLNLKEIIKIIPYLPKKTLKILLSGRHL